MGFELRSGVCHAPPSGSFGRAPLVRHCPLSGLVGQQNCTDQSMDLYSNVIFVEPIVAISAPPLGYRPRTCSFSHSTRDRCSLLVGGYRVAGEPWNFRLEAGVVDGPSWMRAVA